MTARYWADLTTADLAALEAGTVAVLPAAATEQHGPHLPVGVDAIINAGIISRAMAVTPVDLPFLVLPAIQVGLSPEHLDFPGTLSVGSETLLRQVRETAAGVVRAGVRRIVLFNSHGGQPQIMDLVAQELRTSGALATVANSWRLMRSAEFFPAAELEVGVHGGAIETSLMLHLRADLVRREHVADFKSSARDLERNFPMLSGGGRYRFAWQAQDLNAAGAVGDARLADAAIGRALIEQAAQALIVMIGELSRLPLSALKKKD